ncbi:hypothetical protein DP112_02410 [Streptococcus suis]|uniref:hypothetical protein n=1 Tax=Streptococcus suis TaxID=1307 RepID=UPI000E0B7BEA|nr:hypothetical protein [Streptococcus suis]AXI66970.1 hypothetical protein DP112_02410 [Streptococcus suis]NQI35406.1 hypothetical protein [Streptococcus suis]NQI37821.1 hypothetical protein [Streptococcus suis]NQI47822.1 hypothetical protein [Streptococcus suis]HEL9627866.1 hypothetical protein [Streptococcus suis]
MRRDINILWLEDAITSGAHKGRKELVKNILKSKGYEGNIVDKETFEEAKMELETSNRYDFFISDFNLQGDQTGLSYLKEIRNFKGYKQFVILYSNKSNASLKQDVINFFGNKEISNLIFSNFTFFSTGRLDRKNFSDAINVILCRWDELNALRGQYMYENAELEYLLRQKCPEYPIDKPYRELVQSYFYDKLKIKRYSGKRYSDLKNILDNWLLLVDRRNALAHVKEAHHTKEGYYIQSIEDDKKEPFTIYESKLDKERSDLIEVVEMVKKLLENRS